MAKFLSASQHKVRVVDVQATLSWQPVLPVQLLHALITCAEQPIRDKQLVGWEATGELL